MTLEEFKECLHLDDPPPFWVAGLRALWLEAKKDWDGAHETVQDDESQQAAWVHAYLHRKEGDLSNAGYWYRQAGQRPPECSLEQEWQSIASELLRLDSREH